MLSRPGSVNGHAVPERRDSFSQRLRAAAIRASGGALEVKRIADKLAEELEEVTAPHGIPVVELSDEDSMVKAVAELIPQPIALAAGTKR